MACYFNDFKFVHSFFSPSLRSKINLFRLFQRLVLRATSILLALLVAVPAAAEWGCMTNFSSTGYKYATQGEALDAWLNFFGGQIVSTGACGDPTDMSRYRYCPIFNKSAGQNGYADVHLLCERADGTTGVSPDGTYQSCVNPYKGCRTDTMVGNPCNAAGGNKSETETDYVVPGASLLALTRNYNSREGLPLVPAIFGNKWTSNLTMNIRYEVSNWASIAYVSRENGSIHEFRSLNDSWVPDPDILENLVRTNTGWTLTTRDGKIEVYDLGGKS